jgi:TonB family protein
MRFVRSASSLLLLLLVGVAGALPLALAAAPPYTEQTVDTPPVLKKPLKVRYPSSSRKKRGEIVLRFVVTEKGTVSEIVVMRTSDADMIAPAMEAYENARYQPGMKDGKPVPTTVEVTEKAEK